ncbi:MAG TPA: sensor histidine kinase [Solirubrobacteraceae bacterium]|jgi:signal transduction histidine kinase
MSRLTVFARHYAFDLLIVAAALGSALEAAFREPPGPWYAAPAQAALAVALLARRRLELAAPLTVWLAAAALSFDRDVLPYSTGVVAAGMAAAFLLGQLRDDAQGRAGLAVTVGGALVIAYNTPGGGPGDLVVLPVLFAIAWAAGLVLRSRTAEALAAEERAVQAERERETAARLAVAEERARIARELHDIVAHAMSVMVLQIGAVRHNLPASAGDDAEVLAGIERTGRSALAEMRRLLGAMRREGDDVELAPQPGVASLDVLVDAFGRAGLPVRLRREGEAVALPPGLDLSAYRIVQEGLTNALKHGGASRADVLVCFGERELRIDVRDDGAGSAPSDGLGHGLIGVRERVKIYGGDMTAGTADGGGFLLTARLPVEAGRP